MLKVSVITITKNNDVGLKNTYLSFKEVFLLKGDDCDFEWVIKSGDSSISDQQNLILSDPLISNKIVFDNSADTGIYDAMTKASLISSGDLVCYMNSGDVFIPKEFLKMIDYYSIFIPKSEKNLVYGKTKWDGKIISLSRYLNGIYPMLGILPSHQAMLFPRGLQVQYKFDPFLKYYADMDWKIRLLRNGISFYRYDNPVCVGEIGGVSQSISNIRDLFYKTTEVKRIMEKNYNIMWGWIYSLLFYFWNFRKIIKGVWVEKNVQVE